MRLTLEVPDIGTNQFFIDNLLFPSWDVKRAVLAIQLPEKKWDVVSEAVLVVERPRLLYKEVSESDEAPADDPDWEQIEETRKQVVKALDAL